MLPSPGKCSNFNNETSMSSPNGTSTVTFTSTVSIRRNWPPLSPLVKPRLRHCRNNSTSLNRMAKTITSHRSSCTSPRRINRDFRDDGRKLSCAVPTRTALRKKEQRGMRLAPPPRVDAASSVMRCNFFNVHRRSMLRRLFPLQTHDWTRRRLSAIF